MCNVFCLVASVSYVFSITFFLSCEFCFLFSFPFPSSSFFVVVFFFFFFLSAVYYDTYNNLLKKKHFCFLFFLLCYGTSTYCCRRCSTEEQADALIVCSGREKGEGGLNTEWREMAVRRAGVGQASSGS